jgi:hypothetical protein
MDIPKCEICGESEVSVQTLECGMCDDCAADAIREALAPLFGKVCGSVSRQQNGWLQTCLGTYGVEHAH